MFRLDPGRGAPSERGECISTADDEGKLDEACMRIERDLLELDDELLASQELRHDHVETAGEVCRGHRHRQSACRFAGIGRLLGPPTQQPPDVIDVEVQGQRRVATNAAASVDLPLAGGPFKTMRSTTDACPLVWRDQAFASRRGSFQLGRTKWHV